MASRKEIRDLRETVTAGQREVERLDAIASAKERAARMQDHRAEVGAIRDGEYQGAKLKARNARAAHKVAMGHLQGLQDALRAAQAARKARVVTQAQTAFAARNQGGSRRGPGRYRAK